SDASNEGANNLTTWQTQSHLSTLLAAASGVHTELADLPGAALGLHEAGRGRNARITLDSNAAGHGWYVDATPWSSSSPFNDDYLPTSDPNLWLAKPGSGAEGKMDLLTVWLHELGHAAGMEHTESGTGLMGTTLLPGQRRRVQVADQRRADGGWLWRLEFCANRHFVCNSQPHRHARVSALA
ncbi:MAG: matrixin family metalloprotease, partial [Hydrogenophaga sp.]|nr:matrixin family metalloprotease [Hydrogenophaga sp.]